MLTTPSTIAHTHPAYQALNNFVQRAFSPQGVTSGELQAVIDQSRPGEAEQGKFSPSKGMTPSIREVTDSNGLSNATASQTYTQRIWADNKNLNEATQIATSVIGPEKDGINETYMWLFRNPNNSPKPWTAIEGKLYNDHRANGFNKPVLRLEAWQGLLKSGDKPKKALDVSKKDSEVLSFIFGLELTNQQKQAVIQHHVTAKKKFFRGEHIDDSKIQPKYSANAPVQAIRLARNVQEQGPGITLTDRHGKALFFPLEAVCDPIHKHIMGSLPFRVLLAELNFDFSKNEKTLVAAATRLNKPTKGTPISEDEWRKRQKQRISMENQINFYQAQKVKPNYKEVITDSQRVHALLKKAQLHPGALLLDFDAKK